MIRLATTSFLSQLHASPVPCIVRQARRGDTLLPVVFLLLPVFTLLFLFSLLATFLSFLFLRVLLCSMSVQLEKFLGIKFCEVRHEVPQVASPVPGLVLSHILQQAVDVAPNLNQAATGV